MSLTENIWADNTAPATVESRNWLVADRGRWFLWVPVCLGIGAAGYFALHFEPPQVMGLVVLAVVAALFLTAHLTQAGLAVRLPLAILLLASIGFTVAQERTMIVSSPVIVGTYGPARITGRVLDVETTEEGARLTMDRVTLRDVPVDQVPDHIHLRLTKYSDVPDAGSVIRVRGVLMPPAGPAAPGAHDFRRDLFFQRVGGVGYAMGKPVVIATGEQRPNEARLEKLRQHISDRITDVLGATPEAAICIAYLTGERGLIDQPTADNMRNSGLAHLLALSGMKVGLVAIIAFAATRLLLGLVPWLALRINTRKMAALMGIAMALAYVTIAATPIPALRSILMTSLGMTAILFDRQSFSLRLAAIAACIVILWQPEAVTGVSFQMSFGAVIALIAFYEAMRLRISAAYSHSTRARRAMLDVMKLLITTLVATLVTSPLALLHFQQEANYSVVANAVAIPLNDFWIMPFAVIAMLLMPFGLDRPFVLAMGRGVGWMLDIAHEVSRWPGAVTRLPALSDATLVLMELGGLWIILWRGRWRHFGWIGVVAGIVVALFHASPAVLIAEDGKRIAFRMSDENSGGMLAISKLGRGRDFTIDSWNRMNGQRGTALLPDTGDMDGATIHCTADACRYDLIPAQPVVWLRDPTALAKWCAPGAIIIGDTNLSLTEGEVAKRSEAGEGELRSQFFESPPHPNPNPLPLWGRGDNICPDATIIDSTTLRQSGGVALYAEKDGYRIRSVADDIGARPWSINISAAGLPADPAPAPGLP